jgi:hypothetical protein
VYSTIAQQKVSEAMTKSEAARILGHERDLTRRRDVTGIKFACTAAAVRGARTTGSRIVSRV